MFSNRFYCAAAAAALALPSIAHGQSGGANLTTSQSLSTGQALQSPNKQYFAVQQADGNFCVYKGTPGRPAGSNLWCHMRTAPGNQFYTVMQGDGNLCTYQGTPAQQGRMSWCSMQLGSGGQFVLSMQDDGNLCVYKGTPTRYDGGALWCSLPAPATPNPTPPRFGDMKGSFSFMVSNNTNLSVWVTLYSSNGFTLDIVGTACIQPNSGSNAHMAATAGKVRGEMTKGPNCAQPVACDTNMEIHGIKQGGNVSFNYDSKNNGCWWQPS